MIQVRKSADAPESLAKGTSYQGADVYAQLRQDQDGKCYLCEDLLHRSCDVEHFQSQKHFPELKYTWSNLLGCCHDCNSHKSDTHDDLINPIDTPLELYLKISMTDELDGEILFEPVRPFANDEKLAKLLELIHNGKRNAAGKHMRKNNTQALYDKFTTEYSGFKALCNRYLQTRSEDAKKAIVEALGINKEFLGAKFWILQEKPELAAEFAAYTQWNREAPERSGA